MLHRSQPRHFCSQLAVANLHVNTHTCVNAYIIQFQLFASADNTRTHTLTHSGKKHNAVNLNVYAYSYVAFASCKIAPPSTCSRCVYSVCGMKPNQKAHSGPHYQTHTHTHRQPPNITFGIGLNTYLVLPLAIILIEFVQQT